MTSDTTLELALNAESSPEMQQLYAIGCDCQDEWAIPVPPYDTNVNPVSIISIVMAYSLTKTIHNAN